MPTSNKNPDEMTGKERIKEVAEILAVNVIQPTFEILINTKKEEKIKK